MTISRRAVRAPKLSWNGRERRWRFRYRNKNYAVSPKQLECEDTAAASKAAAEVWRDQQVARADKQAYSESAGRLELLVSLEHALRQRGRMVKVGQTLAVRAWSNIVKVVEKQLEDQRVFEDDPSFAIDADAGMIDLGRSTVVELAQARLLTDDQLQQKRFAERFELSDDQLHAPLPTERKGLTLREACDRFIHDKQDGNSLEYVHQIRASMRHLCSILGDDSPASDINAGAVLQIKQGIRILASDPSKRDDTQRRKPKTWGAKTVKEMFAHIRQFVQYLNKNDFILAEPKNLSDLVIKVVRSEVTTFTTAEVQRMLQIAEGNELITLSILLMANCGFTQSDVSDLARSEVFDGRFIRKRSKTRKHENCPLVSYKLWPSTWQALQRILQIHNHPDLAIVGADGNPLKTIELIRGKKRERLSKTDRIRDEFRKVCEGKERPKGTLKLFRKTSASLIAAKYGDGLARHFLGHAALGMAEQHYIKRQQEQIDEAICDSPGLSDTGGSQIMVPNGGQKDEPDEG